MRQAICSELRRKIVVAGCEKCHFKTKEPQVPPIATAVEAPKQLLQCLATKT